MGISLTFITNKENKNLKESFKVLIKDAKFLDKLKSGTIPKD